MKKITVFLFSLILLATMGLGVNAVAPADGVYEDGIYYMTGPKAPKDTGMITVSVIGSTLGLIIVGFAVSRKMKKN